MCSRLRPFPVDRYRFVENFCPDPCIHLTLSITRLRLGRRRTGPRTLLHRGIAVPDGPRLSRCSVDASLIPDQPDALRARLRGALRGCAGLCGALRRRGTHRGAPGPASRAWRQPQPAAASRTGSDRPMHVCNSSQRCTDPDNVTRHARAVTRAVTRMTSPTPRARHTARGIA